MKIQQVLLMIMISFTSKCQLINVNGIVLDNMGVGIPFVNIYTLDGGRSTISNENGEFELRVEKISSKIEFSHINYLHKSMNIADLEANAKVMLEENIRILPELKVEDYALQLIRKAINKSNQDSIYNHFGRGFYRKISVKENSYTALQEIFFDGCFNTKYGIGKWNPTASRYIENKEKIEMKNSVYFALLNSIVDPSIHFKIDYTLLSISDYNLHYIFTVENIINPNTDQEVAVISCSPRKSFSTSFDGRFYIKTSNGSLLRVSGIKKMLVGGNNIFFQIKDSYLLIDVIYQEKNNSVVLSGMDISFHLNVSHASVVNKKIIEKMKLVMYEYESLNKNEQTSLIPFYKTKEEQIFSTTQASPEFWENNPIIKRTPLQDEVIKAFEKKGKKKGGNMFPTPK